jgi:hypothetical protein
MARIGHWYRRGPIFDRLKDIRYRRQLYLRRNTIARRIIVVRYGTIEAMNKEIPKPIRSISRLDNGRPNSWYQSTGT